MNHLPRECFQAPLQYLDLLLHREILRLRASYQLSMDEFRGLYISDNQVDALIHQWRLEGEQVDDISSINKHLDQYSQQSQISLATDPYWQHLITQFGLTKVEQDLLLLALAPDLSLKYETLYAYLNNDITRKFPTVDLALKITSKHQHNQARQALSPAGSLIRQRLLEPLNDNHKRWSLSAGFRLSPSVLTYLLDGKPVDARLLSGSQYLEPWTDSITPSPNVDLLRVSNQPGISILQGESGAGRLSAVRQLLAHQSMQLLSANLGVLISHQQSLTYQLQCLLLQARLGNAALYLTGLDQLISSEANDQRQLKTALSDLQSTDVPIYLSVPNNNTWREFLNGIACTSITFSDPDLLQRTQLWQTTLAQHQLPFSQNHIQAVADRFILNPGQITAAVSNLSASIQLTNPRLKTALLKPEMLLAAARDQSIGDIASLANKTSTTHCWEDLVLPRVTAERIKEAMAAITNRGLVYQQWQMCQRTGGSTGLMMMFTGSSGTGKTMSASLIAKAVGLDLYCIDLSSVVSKYIGDTEKNLDRIFTAARRANCILFFDEADALLGKRSEVKDAHDRYANVEVAYLLQKMEQHNGVVIMATNIAKNIDPAFSRRLHYSIEFPRPNAEHREQLWRGIYPSEAPLADDIDFAFLGRNFEGSGGDIKTIALDAAMQAAGHDQQITMSCLVRAMARQMIKQGKVPSATDFKQYYALIERSIEPVNQNRKQRRVLQHPSVKSR